MNEDLEQLLHNLKLKTIAARFDEMLADAEAAATPVPTLIAQLLRVEWHARQEQALQARIDRADFPEAWTLESFPFKMQKGVKERQIRTFAELDFIPKAENIVFIGYKKQFVIKRTAEIERKTSEFAKTSSHYFGHPFQRLSLRRRPCRFRNSQPIMMFG